MGRLIGGDAALVLPLFGKYLLRPSSICRKVLTTSAGVVKVAAMPPANAPQAKVAYVSTVMFDRTR